MRVIRSSGSVRGGDGNIPAYSAMMGWTAPRAASSCRSMRRMLKRHQKGSRPWVSLSPIVVRHAHRAGSAKDVFRSTIDAVVNVCCKSPCGVGSCWPFLGASRGVVAMVGLLDAHHGARSSKPGLQCPTDPPAQCQLDVRRNKNDAADERDLRGRWMAGECFVRVRSVDNQAQLMRHRVREMLVGQRTQLLNALRGHLAEIGVVAAQGQQHAYELGELLAEGADANGEIIVPDNVRLALAPLGKQIEALDEEIASIDKQLATQVKANPTARRRRAFRALARSSRRRSSPACRISTHSLQDASFRPFLA